MGNVNDKNRLDPLWALAVVPDRDLSLLGLYVRFQSRFWWKTKSSHPMAEPGEIGMIVQDSEGRCSEGQLAIHTARCRDFGVSYLPVPKRILEIQRGM